MTFSEIFQRYFVIYRGRSTSIPASGSREYNLALEYANDAIDEWSRMDGIQWPELWTTSAVEDGLTISSGTTEYDISDMVEPPSKVTLTSGEVSHYLTVLKPWEVKDYTDLNGKAYFTGDPSNGYVLHVTSDDSATYDGYAVDFPYYKKPTQMTGDSDIPEMSDPSFMVHHMVSLRAQKQRNGFLFKASAQKARERLTNMKIKALAGTYGNSARQSDTRPGWGTSSSGTAIFKE